MRKGMLTTRPGDVGLVLHAPLPTEGLVRGDATRLAERARDIIAATVAEVEAGGSSRMRGARIE